MAILRIGLTGGIGSGKSTAAAMLAQLGARILDADAIARELTSMGGAALPSLRQALDGKFFLAEGGLHRALLRDAILRDAHLRAALEAVLHPLIQREVLLRAAQCAAAEILVIEIPLLAEQVTHWRAHLQRIAVVDCTPEQQIQRASARAGWGRESVLAMMAIQASRSERLRIADDVLVNEGSPEELRSEVQRVWQFWKLWRGGV